MARNKLTKPCPRCEAAVAVALRNCKCGFSFVRQTRSAAVVKVESRRSTQANQSSSRAGRTRGKPQFYDSREFEKKKKRKVKTRSTNILCKEKAGRKDTSDSAKRSGKRSKRDEEVVEDLITKLPTEKQEIASIILAELNRKLFQNHFQVN